MIFVDHGPIDIGVFSATSATCVCFQIVHVDSYNRLYFPNFAVTIGMRAAWMMRALSSPLRVRGRIVPDLSSSCFGLRTSLWWKTPQDVKVQTTKRLICWREVLRGVFSFGSY